MSAVLLIQVDPATTALLRGSASGPRDVVFVEATDQATALVQVRRDGATLDALVLGPGVEEPVRLAQRAQTTDRDLAVLILSEPGRLPHLARAVQFAPFVRGEVHCRSVTEGEALATALQEAVARTRQRRSYRATVAAVAARLTETRPSPQPPPTQFFDRLVDRVPIGVAAVDGEGLIVSWNRRAGEILGRREREVLGTPLRDLFPEAEREPLQGLITRCTAANQQPGCETVERVADDGRAQFVEVTAAAVQGRAGEPGALVLLQDVTDRVSAEQERRRAEEERAQLLTRERAARAEAEAAQRRLAFLAEASALLAASLDYAATLASVAQLAVPSLADWCTVHIVEDDGVIHPLAVAHADSSKVELGRQMQRRYPPDPDAQYGVRKVLRTGQSEIYPEIPDSLLVAAARDAEHLKLMRELSLRSLMVVPLVARGRTLGAISFAAAESGRQYGPADLALAEDLARRAAAAVDNARLYQEAQQALRARNEFLSTVSHDLKTPIAAIRGMAQLLRRRLARGGTPETERIAEGLTSIEASTTKMTAIIGELLDVVRLQTGQPLDLHREPTDLVALVQRAVAEHQQTTNRHRIQVEAAVPELTGEWDPIRLERVLGNLLSNAIKYSPAGGPITVTVTPEEDETGAWVRLSVRDRGLGIPAADLPHIFERFRRGANVVGRIEGTGIGLAGAHQIVEQHGGTITAESQEGVGTTFTVRLPLKEQT